MFGILLSLLLSQHFFFPAVPVASSSFPIESPSITLTQVQNLTTAGNACLSAANSDNDMLCLYFTHRGNAIPGDEFRHTLSEALSDVQPHLPDHASEPISGSFFETNITFSRTGDNVWLWVYAFGLGLLWGQLHQALLLLQHYVLGELPRYPGTHYYEIEFYVQLRAGMDVARGQVELNPEAGTVAKRDPATTILQLPQGNHTTSPANVDLPIIFRIPKTNIDLNITSLGLPIPESIFFSTIEKAWENIILNQDDVDAKIPRDKYPYKFNMTSGKPPNLSVTQIAISAATGKRYTYALVCILYYGLRDFLRASGHFNVMEFEVKEGAVGKTGYGQVQYWPEAPGGSE